MSLLDADDFAGDWYGWLTNQMSHALLGLLLYVAFCATWLAGFGEYPARIAAFLVVIGGFAFFEVAIQRGGMMLDSIEDTAFTAYGAGALAVTFHEVTPGESGFVGDIYSSLAVIFVFTLHSIAGIALRAMRARRTRGMMHKIDAKQRHTDTKQHLTPLGVTCYSDRVLGWWCNVRRFFLRARCLLNPGILIDRALCDCFLFLGEKTPQKVKQNARR